MYQKYIMTIMLLATLSCRKFVEPRTPQTQIISADVFTTVGGAQSALEGIYSSMMSSSGFASGGFYSIGYLAGLSSDELENFSTDPDKTSFYTNSLLATSPTVNTSLWQEGYHLIYDANAILEGVASSAIDTAAKRRLSGEAKFIRAFCYFYLTEFFGDIPLATGIDYTVNNKLSKSSSAVIFNQITADLKGAQSSLPENYQTATGASTIDRIRPIQASATALLARVDLFQGMWASAESEATSIINQTSRFQLCQDLNQVFLKNSSEAIWQLKPVIPGLNTNDAQSYILTGTPNNASLSPQLMGSFEAGDARRTAWVDSVSDGTTYYFFPVKYKVALGNSLSEYQMIFRTAEQYLIRAEARLQQNNLIGAVDDLNIIRNRAGLPNSSATDATSLHIAIEKECRVELFTEWGHRWFDLKRWGWSTKVLGPVKFPNWQDTDTLYPIPRIEISNNPKLTQNVGY